MWYREDEDESLSCGALSMAKGPWKRRTDGGCLTLDARMKKSKLRSMGAIRQASQNTAVHGH